MKDGEGIKKAKESDKDNHYEVECRCKESKKMSLKEIIKTSIRDLLGNKKKK